jgi:sensor histidine kinase regulating citrate/malate metabolism
MATVTENAMRKFLIIMLCLFAALLGGYGGLQTQEAEKRQEEQNAVDVAQGSIRVGMTREQLLQAWGKPRHIRKTITAHLTSEQWIYGRQYVYLTNNKISAIQE